MKKTEQAQQNLLKTNQELVKAHNDQLRGNKINRVSINFKIEILILIAHKINIIKFSSYSSHKCDL